MNALATLIPLPSSAADMPAGDRLAQLVADLSGCSAPVADRAVRDATGLDQPRDDEERLAIVARALVVVRRDRRLDQSSSPTSSTTPPPSESAAAACCADQLDGLAQHVGAPQVARRGS